MTTCFISHGHDVARGPAPSLSLSQPYLVLRHGKNANADEEEDGHGKVELSLGVRDCDDVAYDVSCAG